MKPFKKLLGEANPVLVGWIIVLLALIAVGIYGAYGQVVREEEAPVAWALLVPSYVFFALAGIGSSLINSIFAVFGVQRFKPIIKRGIWLSLILVIASWIFILIDLGRPLHVYNLYLFFHPSSRMAWMGALYLIFGLSLILELIVVIREERMPKRAPLVIGIIVLAVELVLATNLGALFGVLTAKPLWSSNLLPLQFLISAMLVGAMIHILFISTTYLFKTGSVPEKLRQLFTKDYRPLVIGLIIINFALIAVKFIPGMFSPATSPYIKLLVTGPYIFLFWGLEIVVGGIIPLIILLYHKTRESTRWLLGASALVIIGVFFSKYNPMISGQSIGPAFTESFIPYSPTAAEILLLVGGTAVSLLFYTLGDRLLPLEPEEKATWFIFGKATASS